MESNPDNDRENTIAPVIAIAHTQVCNDLARADAKAGLLFSSGSLALVLVVAVATEAHVSTWARIAFGATVALVLVAVIVLLLTVRPALKTNAVQGSWLHAAYHGPRGLLAARGRTDEAIAEDVSSLGRIAVANLVRVQRAVDVLIAAVVLLACAVELALLFGGK